MLKLAEINKRLAQSALARALGRMDQPERTFFVIVMPGGFHIAKLAIERFPTDTTLVVIGNGVDAQEAAWAERSLPVHGVLRTRATLMHHDVLDVLFGAWKQDFGILDYDCFVLDPAIVARMTELAPGSAMNAAFYRANRDPALKVPETFLLYFDRDIVRGLMHRYGVATRPIRWHQLTPEVQARLAILGLSESKPPEEHKPYYDTLRLIMMLGVADGHPYRFAGEIPATPTPREDAFHVGGVSDPNSVQGIWALRGAYFWRRVLEGTDDPFLKNHYGKKFGLQGAQALLDENRPLADEIAPEFLAFCERLIAGEPRSAGPVTA